MTLTEFLTARLDEDEALALASSPSVHEQWWTSERKDPLTATVEDGHGDVMVRTEPDDLEPTKVHDVAAHIARHDPERVLREVEAKRKILDDPYEFGGEPVVRVLAAVYSDHPDYDKDWA